MPTDEEIGKALVLELEARAQHRFARLPHLSVADLVHRLAHRPAVVTVEPGPVFPERTIDEVRALHVGGKLRAHLPDRINAPVELHRLVVLAGAQELEQPRRLAPKNL